MIKVLHTSDWHLARRFKGYSLLEYQKKALDWLVRYVENERIDVVLVSGDVFDSPMPPNEAFTLLSDTLNRLTAIRRDGKPAVDVVLTPGNHDAAEKLGFTSRNLIPQIHIRHRIEDISEPVVIRRGDEELLVYAWPYMSPDIARPILEERMRREDIPTAERAGDGTGDNAWQSDIRQGRGQNDGGQNDDGQDADDQNDGGRNSNGRNNDGRTDDGPGDGAHTAGHLIARSHEGVIRQALRFAVRDLERRRAANPHAAAVLMAHAFIASAVAAQPDPVESSGHAVTEGEQHDNVPGKPSQTDAPSSTADVTSGAEDGETVRSDSENSISIGGVDSVPAGVFANSGFDYLALGHLHRCQRVRVVGEGQLPIAQYSGSLLAYSFSEAPKQPVAGNGKAVCVVEFRGRNVTGPTCTAVQSGQPALVSLRGSLSDILSDRYARFRDAAWVSVHATYDPQTVRNPYGKVKEKFQHVLETTLIPTQTAVSADEHTVEERKRRSELQVLEDFVHEVSGALPTDAEREVLRDALESVREDARRGKSEESVATLPQTQSTMRDASVRTAAHRPNTEHEGEES